MSRMSELDMDRQNRVPRHLKIQRMCGTYAAACYLRNREYTLEQALDMLDLRPPVPRILLRPEPGDVTGYYDGRLPSLLRYQAGVERKVQSYYDGRLPRTPPVIRSAR